MSLTNPPGWLQNAGDTHTAAQLRQYHNGLTAGTFSGATSLRARGGIHPALGQEFIVTQAGSPNMTVLVESGVASIPGTESGSQGNYWVCNDAQVILNITAAHATLARIDLIVVNVRDQAYSGANNDSQLQVIAGTPASSPVAPSAPNNSIIIAQVAVGAAVSSITNANITDTRYYVAATGGVINARNDAARPASTEVSEGQLVYSMNTDVLYVWNGSAYGALNPVWQTWPPTLTNMTLGNGTVQARYIQFGKMITFRFKFKLGTTSAMGSAPAFSLPVAQHASYEAFRDPISCEGGLSENGATTHHCMTFWNGTASNVEIIAFTTTATGITSSIPFVWGNLDQVDILGTYEAA